MYYPRNYKQSIFKLIEFVIHCINNSKGEDIICLDMHKYAQYSVTDFMILCTGQSNQHVVSIAQNILYQLRRIEFSSYHNHTEGLKSGEWILLDLGDIIIHVMQKKTRELYSLEKLWS